MKQHELNELCIALRHEIYTLRRTINEQNKDIIKKDKLISNLVKKVYKLEKEIVLTEIFNNDPLNILNIDK